MNKQLKIWSLVLSMFAVVAMNSCKDDPALPDNLASFEAAEAGFEGTDTEVKIILSRAEGTAITVNVNVIASKVAYGTDFTTEPATANGAVALTIPAGNTEGVIKVKKVSNGFLTGDEFIEFTLQTVQEPVLLGVQPTVKLSFKAITSEGSTLTLVGRSTDANYLPANAINYARVVFADLSGNAQTPIDRKSWNLGFYSGSDFKVALNSSYQTTAAALAKTDISTVSLADAELVPNLNHNISDATTLALVDYYGDINKLVFANVSATDSENKVYLVSFEGSKNKDQWYKVKVNRNGTTGYKVQYALIGETTIKSIDVAKNANYNFSFLSLTSNSVVAVEPYKTNWDLQWGYDTYMSVATDPNSAPYFYQDFVAINHLAGTKATEIISVASGAQTANDVSAALYTSFVEANLTGITWVSTRDAIGSKWRTTTGAGIKKDRFYLIQDPSGNIYKLKFNSMGVGDTGERGRPVIEYKLVKKAS